MKEMENGDKYISGIVDTISGDLDTVSGNLNTVSGDLDRAEADIVKIKAELGLEGDASSGQSIADKINYISGVVKGSEISGAIGSLRTDLTALDGEVDNLDAFVKGLKIEKIADTTGGYAAAYRLRDAAGSTIGSVINIPRDQFLSGAAYNAATSALVLTFAINEKNAEGFETTTPKTISIPASSFVHEYTAGAGIAFDASTASFKLVKYANEDSKFLQIGADTIGLNGITKAISGATSGVIADVTTLKGDDQTSGSVLYAVRTKAQFAEYTAEGDVTAASGTIQYAIRSNTAAINTLNGNSSVVGSVDYKITQYDNSISSLIANIEALNNSIK